MTRSARLRAYAKLNLGLRVLYKRDDGYHEIRTVFQTVSLADTLDISFTSARKTTVTIDGTPEIADNLVEKASLEILEALSLHGDVRFNLRKRIPSGAGLGGGSSDAAAVLLALPVLAGKQIAEENLVRIASRLGSDVPFFLYGGAALGLRRGEELYPLPDEPPCHGLIVAPEVHSSTAEAYRRLSATLTTNSLQNKLSSFQRDIWQTDRGHGVNDFQNVVFSQHPQLERIVNRLRKLGAEQAAMTGSGSALFGLFANPAAREKALKALANERVFPISFLSRASYRSRWRRALSPHIKKTLLNQNQWPPQSLYAR